MHSFFSKTLSATLIGALVLQSIVVSLIPGSVHASTTPDGIDPLGAGEHISWSDRIGYMSWDVESLRGTPDEVIVYDDRLKGHVWSENVGWMSLSGDTFAVTNNGAGVLGGYAWLEGDGFVSFSGVTIDANGYFHGHATHLDSSLNPTGYIRMNCSDTSTGTVVYEDICSTNDFKVRTDWTFDLVPPEAPTVISHSSGALISDGTPTFTGTGETGAIIELYNASGSLLGTGMTTASGWVVTSAVLPQGTQELTFILKDAEGNSSAPTLLTITVDTLAPEAPGVTSPNNGAVLADTTPTVTGTGEIGATVEIRNGSGILLATTTVGTGGTWSVDTSVLPEGEQSLLVVQIDEAGNASAVTTRSVVIDSIAPSAPAVATPVNGASYSVSSLPVTGSGMSGATINVYSASGTLLGTGTVDAAGNYTVTIDAAVEGTYTIDISQTGLNGLESASVTRTYTIDRSAPAAPVITSPADGSFVSSSTLTVTGSTESGALVEIIIDGTLVGTGYALANGTYSIVVSGVADGAHVITAQVTDAAGNTSPVSASTNATVDTVAPVVATILEPGEYVSSVRPTFSGTGEVGANFSILSGATLLCGGVIAPDGTYSCTATLDIGQGTLNYTVESRDAAGNTSSAVGSTIIDTVAPATPTVRVPDQATYTNDAYAALSGTGEAGTLIDIYNSANQLLGTTTVLANSTWNFTPNTPWADGYVGIRAINRDLAGNQSTPYDHFFYVDTSLPGAPVIQNPGAGDAVNTSTPTFDGTAEPNALVILRNQADGSFIGSGYADATGNWNILSTVVFTDGVHVVEAKQTDAGGNESVAHAITFSVDTLPPAAPGLVSPASGDTVASFRPTLTGTGEPGALISVRDSASQSLGSVVVAPDGTWSLIITDDLTEGSNTLSITAQDSASNLSSPTVVVIILDTTGPGASQQPNSASGVSLEGFAFSGTSLAVYGTGEANSTLVFSGNGLSPNPQTITLDANGLYTGSLTFAAGYQGSMTIEMIPVDAVGNTGAVSTFWSLSRDSISPTEPTFSASRYDAEFAQTLVAGTGEPGATVEVSGSELQPSPQTFVVAADGTWSGVVNIDAAYTGTTTISAVQVDSVGNTSAANTSSIQATHAEYGAGAMTVNMQNETLLADMDITGRVSSGSTLQITVNGSSVVVTMSNIRDFSATLAPLNYGNNTVVFTITDQFGGVSQLQRTVARTYGGGGSGRVTKDECPNGDFSPSPYDGTCGTAPSTGGGGGSSSTSVDSSNEAPSSPAVTSPENGAATESTRPTITGTGEPGATVTIRDSSGALIGTATVSASGTWSLTPNADLAVGVNTLRVSQKNTSGVTSPAVTLTITVDAGSAPAAETPTQQPVDNTGKEAPKTETVRSDEKDLGAAPIQTSSEVNAESRSGESAENEVLYARQVYSTGQIYNQDFFIDDGGCYALPKNPAVIWNNARAQTFEELKFGKSLSLMVSYDITRYRLWDEFRPGDTITRAESAKMLVNMARNVLCRQKVRSYEKKDIRFNDIARIAIEDPELKEYLILAYEYGIFNGEKDGRFRPDDTLTNQELTIILSRLISGYIMKESEGKNWAEVYRKFAERANIVTGYQLQNPSETVTRMVMGNTMFTAYKHNRYIWTPQGGFIVNADKLVKIAENLTD